MAARLSSVFTRSFAPFLDRAHGARNRFLLWLGIGGLIAVSLALPVFQLVVMKMLPFDNKSEFQVVVDMPAGSSLEQTAAVLHEMGGYLATVPEVADYQAFAGASAPINFNGLVRQYYLRRGTDVGDLQVNLVDKAHRDDQSHAIATRVRPALTKIADAYGARVKVVEVPPGPPVLSPIVAEIYGPDDAGRIAAAKAVEAAFRKQAGVVDADVSAIADAPRWVVNVDRAKAALAGVRHDDAIATLRAGLAGDDVTYVRDASKYPTAIRLQLPGSAQGDLDALLQLTVRSAAGKAVPLREVVTVDRSGLREQPRYHKDLLPVEYVVGDTAGVIDSPLYGMFALRPAILALPMPGGGTLAEHFISQPDDPYRGYSIKWDGEWQVTYETFRDMGLAYAVGLVLIYLLVVAQFGSYLTPLIIMAPIPLTIIGVMPGHALLGAQFTATSMIGMIALAGIIVRNSILLVDFINLQIRRRRAVPRGGRALGGDPRAADRAHRAGRDARRVLHPRRPDLQRARRIADLRHPGLDAADARRDPAALLRSLSPQVRGFHGDCIMTSWQLVRIIAGIFILLSLALGIPGSPVFVSAWWLAFTAFVAVNLLQSGFTRWCLMESMLRKLGVRAGT